jgi:hypothetical protein
VLFAIVCSRRDIFTLLIKLSISGSAFNVGIISATKNYLY